MPTYQYRCEKCEKGFERTETISEHAEVNRNARSVGAKKGHLRAGPCFCGDIQEELKDSEELWSSAAGSDRMDRQHTEAARTTTGAAASAGATAATAITIRCKPDMLFISRNVMLLFG